MNPNSAPLRRLLLVSLAFFAQVTSILADTESADDCIFYVLADDSFKLSVNGKEKWKGEAHDQVAKKTLPLKKGEVVTVIVTDKQGGRGGLLAIVILRGDTVVASSKDFRYSIEPPPDFASDKKVRDLKFPERKPLLQSFGLGVERQPEHVWTKKGDRDHPVVHFKWVADK